MHNQEIKGRKQVISILFLIIIMLFTAFTYLRGYSVQKLLETLKNINYCFLTAGLAMMVLFVSCEATNICMIMRVLGQPLPYLRCFQYSCIGFYFSSITPSASGGQPAQIYYMKKDDIPITLSSITIFFIVFVYQITMVFWGLLMVVLRYGTAVRFASKLKYLLIYGSLVNIGAILLLFSLMFSRNIVPNILSFLVKAGSKLRLIKKTDEVKSKLDRSMTLYQEKALALKSHPILFFKVFFVTMIQMAALNLMPYLIYRSMGYHTSHILDLFTCQSLLTISVSAIPLPGAEGVTQGGFLQVFDLFFPQSAITSAMLINRTISFYIPLVLSFFVYIFVHLRTMKRSIK
ncbi:MAG TPA: hypothetical protein DDY59_11455 [Lachnospiraceae bacterium]|jgi:hypothetical protein|nr:hypothetical protein [Lachnospiraceae bacterium]HCM14240.1 hypothetical protein [Lachnospiraceae bacterium]HCR40842.1 hypothetical protein [Lachnospiraceae bacterium]